MSKFLTAEQIAALGDGASFRCDTPPGVTPICAYCGAETKQVAYTDLKTGSPWPPCCAKPECLDKWEPLKN